MDPITLQTIFLALLSLIIVSFFTLYFYRVFRESRKRRQFPREFLGGRYRIGHELGRGMNAVTYRVEDNMNPAIPLAAKVLLTPEEEPRISRASFNRHVKRFKREIENMKKLKDCKFIVPLYDFQPNNIQPFFVMKLCDGSLQDELTEIPLPMNMILDVLLDVCEGLQEIHDRKVFHRDLKPANILKYEDRWVLADFGMSLMEGYGGVVTVPDSLPGTIPYTAPEVMYNEPSTIGPPADIFSLGIALKAMFTGNIILEAKASDLLPKRINIKTKRQIKLFDDLIEEMTRMNQKDRPQSISEVAKKIEGIFYEVDKIKGRKQKILLSKKHRERLKSIKREEKEKIFHEYKGKKVLFSDDIEKYSGWENYMSGTVKQSDDFVYKGKFSLKKDKNSDPHGGFKRLEKQTELGIVLSGWIYRPSESTGGLGDRLAVEDEKFNGYGFTVAHNSNLIWIDRRDEGKSTVIGSPIKCPVQMDKWYQFRFYMKIGGKFDLRLYDNSGKEFFYTKDISDIKYSKFDRLVVHGGYPYYIDELKLEKI